MMNNFPAFYSSYASDVSGFTPSFFTPGFLFVLMPLFMAVLLCVLILKGYALWHAARNSQKWWFIALLVINTMGILEIAYLVWFRPKSGIKEVVPAKESAPA